MRAKRLTAVLACAAAALACRAADEYEVKVYPCPRADSRLVVDGKLSEPAWDKAPLVGGFTFYDRPELVEPQTFLRVLHTDTHLYFGVACDEPLMKRVVPLPQARDMHAIFSGETLEFFVDPTHDHAGYCQVAASAAGSVYDSWQEDPMWNAEASAAAALEAARWTLELAIPWKDLGVEPRPGMVLGFNVCRDRQVGAEKLWCNWSQTKANFHDPARFAHLVLSPDPEQLGRLGGEFRKGGRTGPIMIFSRDGSSQATYRSLAETSVAALEGLLAELEKAKAQEADARAREELGKLLAKFRSEITPVRKALASKAELDAEEWTRMDLKTNRISSELDTCVWRARLSALLSGI